MINYKKKIKKELNRDVKRKLRLHYFKKFDFLDLFELKSYFKIDKDIGKEIKKAYNNLEVFRLFCINDIFIFERRLEFHKDKDGIHKFCMSWTQEDIEEAQRRIEILNKYLNKE